MTTNTSIEWATKTWGVVLGCKKVSAGCDNCYAIRTAHRLAANPNPKIGPLYIGLTKKTETGLDWTGLVRTVPGRLEDPLHWRDPQRVFVNSQSDLFHPSVPVDFIAEVWAVMAATPKHVYQILTKRPDIAKKVLSDPKFQELVRVTGHRAKWDWPRGVEFSIPAWPLSNVWLGTSVEDQESADSRVPKLLDIPAAVRWISAEPLLGYVRIADWADELDWVVVGGESGPGARAMHPQWARSLRGTCSVAGVPFLFKQRGAWTWDRPEGDPDRPSAERNWFGEHGKWMIHDGPTPSVEMWRVGKKAAGRLLDGVEHNGYPVEQVAS